MFLEQIITNRAFYYCFNYKYAKFEELNLTNKLKPTSC